ncbi:MAG TPA: hypothetical protein VM370_02205 [Candidatus Thermoplasmatota archaeon]|nr:hypothetical protein [Candidatus Thermoplasmatota archaeon]
MSALSVAVVLFLIGGGLHVVIGALTPIAIRQGWGSGLIYTRETDTVLFGKPSDELRSDPAIMKLREITLGMIAGLLVGVGILEIAIAWFGLRAGQAWALGALVAAQALMIGLWALGHRLWIQAGGPGGLGALQPFEYVPAFLLVPAAVAGWVGLR